MHSDTLIDKSNYRSLMNKAKEEKRSINPQNYISVNSGSIFNGYLSAFAISKMIFKDCILNKTNKVFVGDLYRDLYQF